MKPQLIFSNFDDLKNPFYGGGGAVVINKITAGLAKNYRITVITGSYKNSRDEYIKGIFYKRIGLAWLGPQLNQLLFQLILPYYAAKLNYDLWIESFTPPFSTSFLPLFTKKRVIGLVQMLCGEDMERKYHLPFQFIEKLGLKTYSHILTTSDIFKEKLRKKGLTSQIKTIQLGSEINNEKAKMHLKKKHLLFIGRIEMNQKGLDLLLSAYQFISNKTDYQLVIAGTGIPSDVEKMGQTIKKLNLGDRVKLLGHVSGQKKINIFSQAVAVVIPSRFETLSITALESLSMGVPLITFNILGLSWIPQNCRLVANSFNEKELSRHMLNVSKNKSFRRKLSANALKFSRGFSWKKTIAEYKSYLAKINS